MDDDLADEGRRGLDGALERLGRDVLGASGGALADRSREAVIDTDPAAARLVVADASLFPTNLGVNPMSAIMAVAACVAEAWT